MREKYIKLLPKFLDAVKEKEMSYCVHYSFVGKCVGVIIIDMHNINIMWYKEVYKGDDNTYIYIYISFLTQYNSPTIINHCNRYMNLQDRLRMDMSSVEKDIPQRKVYLVILMLLANY